MRSETWLWLRLIATSVLALVDFVIKVGFIVIIAHFAVKYW